MKSVEKTWKTIRRSIWIKGTLGVLIILNLVNILIDLIQLVLR